MVGYANSLSGLIVVLLAPILGAYADISTKREKTPPLFASLGFFVQHHLTFLKVNGCLRLPIRNRGCWIFRGECIL